jgi:hypothetical protein
MDALTPLTIRRLQTLEAAVALGNLRGLFTASKAGILLQPHLDAVEAC